MIHPHSVLDSFKNGFAEFLKRLHQSKDFPLDNILILIFLCKTHFSDATSSYNPWKHLVFYRSSLCKCYIYQCHILLIRLHKPEHTASISPCTDQVLTRIFLEKYIETFISLSCIKLLSVDILLFVSFKQTSMVKHIPCL